MNNKQPKPHPHAELIKAWADGAKIQSRHLIDFDNVEQWSKWTDDDEPEWCDEDYQFRIKPEEPWKPKLKEIYFFVNTNGKTDFNSWFGTDLDNNRYEFGNCFKTREEAQAAVPRVEAVLKNNWVTKLVAVESIDGKPLSTGEKKLIQEIRKTVLRGAYNENAILVFPLDGSVDSTSHIIAFDTHGDDMNDNKIREAINLIAEEQTKEEIKNGQKPKNE